MTNGDYLVTEINGDWANEMSLGGRVAWSANPAGVLYPSDSNEVYPGRYLTADYSDPGQVAEFTSSGRVVWRMGGFNQPSLALPLPNGDILLNDDFNHRVCVVDPATHRIVWQYGHTGKAGGGLATCPTRTGGPGAAGLAASYARCDDGRAVTRGGLGFRSALRRDRRVEQQGRARRAGHHAGSPLAQAREELAVAERHGGLQAVAGLYLGQVHDASTRSAPPGRRPAAAQRGPGGARDRQGHLGRGDDLAAHPDFDVTWRVIVVLPGSRVTGQPRCCHGPVTALPGGAGTKRVYATTISLRCERPRHGQCGSHAGTRLIPPTERLEPRHAPTFHQPNRSRNG